MEKSQPTDGRGRATGLLISALTIVLALGLCEIVLRLAWSNPYAHEGRDSYLHVRIHQPGKNLRLDRGAIEPSPP